jgi:hypothetical protein
MAKIVISDLHLADVETFIHNLTPAQKESLLGGHTSIYITNISDEVKINSSGDNTIEGANSYNFRDNKVNTIDYSRSNYNWIYVGK